MTFSMVRAASTALNSVLLVALLSPSALSSCNSSVPSDSRAPTTEGRHDREGAITAVAETLIRGALMPYYDPPFYLSAEGLDPPSTLLARMDGIEVRPMSESGEGDPRRVWIEQVVNRDGNEFEIDVSYGSYAARYRATLTDSGWRAESGMVIVLD